MILHRLANTLLKALMPLSAIRQAQAFGWDHEEKWLKDESWLADVEADHDAWEADELWQAHQSRREPCGCLKADPPWQPWECELHMINHPDPGDCPLDFTGDTLPPGQDTCCSPVEDTTTPPEVVLHPAGETGAANGLPGGALKSDEQIIHELVEDYREFLRACFGKK